MSALEQEAAFGILDMFGPVAREADIPRSRRVYVNRNLRLDGIELVGFDMDYTLSLYNQPEMERLSIALTLKKLVEQRGYPPAILELDYDPRWAIRGLVVDRLHGNVLKMDRYGYVGRVYHGKRLLSKEERNDLYRKQRIRLSAARWAWIDTLFALPEAVMYIALVDYLDANPRALKKRKVSYARLWRDVRECIDEAHRDDTLKSEIMSNLGKYIVADPDLPAALHKLRSSGKRLFVLTNSLWTYTNAVMTYLLDGKLGAYPSWRNYFDVIIVGGAKPAFFTEREPFYEIDLKTGQRGAGEVKDPQLYRGRVYQGGNIQDFERMAGSGGDRVLYIGDHIYGDMLRAKKSSIWRTAMVIQELEDEILVSERFRPRIKLLEELDRKRRNLDAEIDYQQLVLKALQRYGDDDQKLQSGASVEEARRQAKMALDDLRAALRLVIDDFQRLDRELDRQYNPFWGALFREGNENSRFGEQVEDYACVYTSRATNFLHYSPLRYFRSPRAHMPHEQ